MTVLLNELLLSTPEEEQLTKLVKEYRLLEVEYQVMCAELAHSLCTNEKIDEALAEQINEARKLAIYLAKIYDKYLLVPREVERFLQEIDLYQRLQPSLENQPDIAELTPPDTLSKKIRQNTASMNPLRLFLLRLKRLLHNLIPLLKKFKHYARFVEKLEFYANPAIAYLAWIFFLPRLLTNLIILAKHSLWMEDEEALLLWQLRFALSFERRWFELANDSAWITVGVLNCFVFIGALTPIGIYCSYALFAYDVVTILARTYIELDRLERLRSVYVHEQKIDLLNALDERIVFEQKRLSLSVLSASASLVVMTFTLPLFTFGLIAPVIIAALLVTITIASYTAGRYLEAHKPVDSITHLEKNGALSKFSIFAPVSEDASPHENVEIGCCNG